MRDEWFVRGKVPMTKSEIRTISIAKLELEPDSVVYDIGAGTGSVSVEISLGLSGGKVYAVEQKEEAWVLIDKNKQRFGCDNLVLVKGTAPECLVGLPTPDRVFIGGSSGNLHEILDVIFEKNKQAQVVVNAITLETKMEMLTYAKNRRLPYEMIEVQISNVGNLGRYHRMEVGNPITILTLQGEGEEKEWE